MILSLNASFYVWSGLSGDCPNINDKMTFVYLVWKQKNRQSAYLMIFDDN